METTSNSARKDGAVRAALKEQQVARLAAKAKVCAGEIEASAYSAMYEKQPEQIARRKTQEATAAARRIARNTAVASGIANAQGGASAFTITEGDAE